MTFLRKTSSVAVSLAFLLLPHTSMAQSASDVVRAFMKMDAKIETGLSLRDYAAALADVKFELKNLEDTSNNPAHADSLKELQAAMSLHTEANQLWRLSLGRPDSKFLKPDSELAKMYVERYPDSGKHLAEGGAMMGAFGLHIERLIPHLWKDAAMRVENARSLLARAQEDEKAKAQAEAQAQAKPQKSKKNAR